MAGMVTRRETGAGDRQSIPELLNRKVCPARSRRSGGTERLPGRRHPLLGRVLRRRQALNAFILLPKLGKQLLRAALSENLLELGAVARDNAHTLDYDVDHVPGATLLAEPVVHLHVPRLAADDVRLDRGVAQRLLAFSVDDHLLLAKLPDASAIAHSERALELTLELLALLRSELLPVFRQHEAADRVEVDGRVGDLFEAPNLLVVACPGVQDLDHFLGLHLHHGPRRLCRAGRPGRESDCDGERQGGAESRGGCPLTSCPRLHHGGRAPLGLGVACDSRRLWVRYASHHRRSRFPLEPLGAPSAKRVLQPAGPMKLRAAAPPPSVLHGCLTGVPALGAESRREEGEQGSGWSNSSRRNRGQL